MSVRVPRNARLRASKHESPAPQNPATRRCAEKSPGGCTSRGRLRREGEGGRENRPGKDLQDSTPNARYVMRHGRKLLAALTLISISGPRARADLFDDVNQEYRDQSSYQRDLDRFQADFAQGNLGGEIRDLQ